MNKNIFQSFKVIVLAFVISIGISYVSAWTAPTVTPPGGNVAAPINTSINTQTKVGGLTVWGLVSDSLTANTLKITGGTLGQVLTSDADGNALWKVASAAGVPTGGICGAAHIYRTTSGVILGSELQNFNIFTAGISYVSPNSARGCTSMNINQDIDATELQWIKNHCYVINNAMGFNDTGSGTPSADILCWN